MVPAGTVGQIDIWLAFPEEIRHAPLLDTYRALLTEQERQQERRYHFSKDRHRYLITRALVRTVLSKYAAVAPEQWQFTANAYGKPEIANAVPGVEQLSFNISHTDGLVALAITRNQALGIDVEHLRARSAPLDAASQFFTAHEAQALLACPAHMQHDRFFQYWTLKESYIKARGMGLSIPLDQFSFDLQRDAEVGISFDPRLDDHPSRWRFWQFRIGSDFLMSLCVQRGDASSHPLRFIRHVPLANEHAIDCALLRASP